MIFSAQQHTPVELRKLLGWIAAGVQRQRQKPIGNGKADAGRCGLEALAVQAVAEIDFASAAKTVDGTREKVIRRVLALQNKLPILLLKIAPDEQQSGTFFLFISPYAVGLGGIVKCDRMGVVPEDRLDK